MRDLGLEHILLPHALYCRPPIPENEEIPTHFHQDSGRVNSDIEVHPRPRLSIKVAYWLSNCSRPERGNLVVIPGSQNYDNLDELQDTMHEGTVSICGNPGDAVIFDRRLWHSSSPNKSTLTRKALFYGYGYRWLQPKDNMTISPETIKQYGRIRQQLLGFQVITTEDLHPFPMMSLLKLGWRKQNFYRLEPINCKTAFVSSS